MKHFADRLADAVRAKGNAVCVGLDPRWESLPTEVRRRHGDASLEAVASAYEAFCGRVLDLTAPLVPVVKPQAAFFERAVPPAWPYCNGFFARPTTWVCSPFSTPSAMTLPPRRRRTRMRPLPGPR